MKKRYGLKSLAILYGLYTFIAAYAVGAIWWAQSSHHRHFHMSVGLYLIITALVFLLLFFLRMTLSRYNFAIIENGIIKFTSLNPAKPPVTIAIDDIRSMRYEINEATFAISTRNDEINIKESISLSEVKKLFDDIITCGPRIQVSGTDAKPVRKYRKFSLALRIIHIVIITALIWYLMAHSSHQ